MTTYFPLGVFGKDVFGVRLFTFLEISLPSGFRTVCIDCTHSPSVITVLKYAAASFQLFAYSPWSIIVSQFSAAARASFCLVSAPKATLTNIMAISTNPIKMFLSKSIFLQILIDPKL